MKNCSKFPIILLLKMLQHLKDLRFSPFEDIMGRWCATTFRAGMEGAHPTEIWTTSKETNSTVLNTPAVDKFFIKSLKLRKDCSIYRMARDLIFSFCIHICKKTIIIFSSSLKKKIIILNYLRKYGTSHVHQYHQHNEHLQANLLPSYNPINFFSFLFFFFLSSSCWNA